MNWLKKISTFKPYKPGDALAMAEYLQNRKFDSPEEAKKFIVRTILKDNKEFGAIFGKTNPNDAIKYFIFPEIEGKFRVHPQGGMPDSPKPVIEYGSSHYLKWDQIRLYHSYYGPEFGSLMSDMIYINIDVINPTESVQQEQVKSMMEFIKDGGELMPILLDDGYGILDGHHRYYAAKGLGVKKVPVVFKYNPDEYTPEELGRKT